MGVIFSLLAGLLLGLFQAFNARAREAVEIRKGTAILLVGSTLIVGVALLATTGVSRLVQTDLSSFVFFGIAGIVHFGFGWTLLSVSQRTAGAGRTGVLVGATPVFTAVLGFVVFRERLSVPATLGIILVVLGIIVVSMDAATEEGQ